MVRQLAVIAALATVAAAGILSDCTNIDFREKWLVADCLTGKDASTRINSAVFIGNKLTNNDGNLQWQANGGYATYCRDCTFAGTTYTCSCRPNFGQYKWTSINLEEHIANYNGFLLSNLTGPARTPSRASTVPVPASFSYDLRYAATNCTSPEDYYECNDDLPLAQPGDCANGGGLSLNYAVDCFKNRWYFPWEVYTTFQSLQPGAAVSGAWEFTVFGDLECSGAPLGKAPEGACSKFAEFGVGVRVEPLFNGDWRV
ncbi:Cyanovirin-N [Microdochium trichocladiopsis]|uniref:Cyanovirin-N n=1 Tax=Microdochium trichocladiopsis TaxID=1682393 RepID=A0A9P8XX12_9PEZI|nr:Cyanovirin-N [Microdochium trichocladiopsis]KAH7018013.1 Cyanovirin-N [Microdochium trichocladiopsis]